MRKWFLPGLASPLLIVRDPILLLIYGMAFAKGVFPRGAFMAWITGISVVAVIFSVVGNQAPLVVQLFGFRADFLHLPLIFLIPNLFDRDDLRKVARWTLIVGLPMALLVLLQFSAGSASRLNVAVGGEGTMLDAAYGHIRPSGTFSFGNGLGDFTAAVAAFCVYGAFQKGAYPRLLWLASMPALAILILLSGSRTAVAWSSSSWRRSCRSACSGRGISRRRQDRRGVRARRGGGGLGRDFSGWHADLRLPLRRRGGRAIGICRPLLFDVPGAVRALQGRGFLRGGTGDGYECRRGDDVRWPA